MERYVIRFNPDADGDPDTYWDGTTASTDLNASNLYSTLVTARQAAGGLQTQFTDREVTVVRVTVTVAIATAVAA